MDKVLVKEYENPEYPISISFNERKKQDGASELWAVRENDVELIIVNNGELNISCGNDVFKVHAGQGFAINRNSRHRITSSLKEDTAFYSLVFDPVIVTGKDTGSEFYEKYVSQILDAEKYPCFLLDEDNLLDENVLDKINSIIAVNTTKRFGYEVLTKGYICLLWAHLLEFLSGKSQSFNGRNVPSQDELRVKSAIRFMEESYSDPITLEDIADKIHVSRNECCRCFKRVMMISPVEYLIRLRVFMAAKVIYKNPLSVDSFSELAFSCGFNNTSYFNKMFKRFLFCTPTEFSKMLKNEPEKAKKIYDNLQDSIVEFV